MISKANYHKILKKLSKLYPTAATELIYHNGFELLVAVVLSAQTTDKQVNKVTPILFKRFPTPKKLGMASQIEVESVINSIGLYRNKSKNIIKLAQIIHKDFHDEIPNRKEDLKKLPGVGEKTASVVMGDYFHVPALAVDTHITRLAKRWDLVDQDAKVDLIQKKMMEYTPKKDWVATHHRLIIFGRYFCTARNPQCLNCELLSLCKTGKERFKIKS